MKRFQNVMEFVQILYIILKHEVSNCTGSR